MCTTNFPLPILLIYFIEASAPSKLENQNERFLPFITIIPSISSEYFSARGELLKHRSLILHRLQLNFIISWLDAIYFLELRWHFWYKFLNCLYNIFGA